MSYPTEKNLCVSVVVFSVRRN